jgi:hypothetical protein
MVGTNKILTVSYGTFSCTLEGFDDSFDTMKSIAEYFRDLAADDRYFGAEPPTPDAEMLARIAENEIQRRVEAKVDDTGVHLRTAPAVETLSALLAARPLIGDAPVAISTPVPSLESPLDDLDAVSAEPETEMLVEQVTALDTNLAAPVAAGVVGALVAGAALADDDAEETEDFLFETLDEVTHSEAEAEAEAEAEVVSVSDAVDHDELVATDDVAPLIDDTFEDEDILDDVQLPETAIASAVETSPTDSVASKLARIRAAVANAVVPVSTPVAAEDAYEDEAEQLLQPSVDLDHDDVEDAMLSPDAEVDADGDLDALAASVAEGESEIEEIANGPVEQESADTTADEQGPETTRPRPRVIKVRKASVVSAFKRMAETAATAASGALNGQKDTANADPQPTEDEADATMASVMAEIADAEQPEVTAEEPVGKVDQSTDTSLSAEAEADLMRELAEVEREMGLESLSDDTVTEETVEAAIEELSADDTAESDVELDVQEPAQPPKKAGATTLPPLESTDEEQEAINAAVARADAKDASEASILAAVQGLTGGSTDATPPAFEDTVSEMPDGIEDAVQSFAKSEAAAVRRSAALEPDVPEEDRVNRLLDHTNSQLEGSENKRRRSAIAHLKAAVLATKAEGDEGLSDEDDPEQAYRDDLAKVVRPHRLEQDISTPSVNSVEAETTLAEEEPASEANVPERAVEIVEVVETNTLAAQPELIADEPVEDAEPEEAIDPALPVRPSRPTSAKRTPRPERPNRAAKAEGAPLVLVSEQRVSEDAPVAAPVQPRRVTKGHLAMPDNAESEMIKTDEEAAGIFADSTTFSDFSDNMGASGLQELLECAAAYTSYVEGRPHFSHPEIMRRVARLDGQDGLTREDSLRSFGQLLRQGKIRKVSRGQFTISQSSRYIQDARAASQ